MKLLAILRTYKNRLVATISSNELYVDSLISLLALIVVAAVIWFYGPHASFYGHTPLVSQEKRIYAILACFLAWLLKFLMFDLDFPTAWQQSDPRVRHHIDL